MILFNNVFAFYMKT